MRNLLSFLRELKWYAGIVVRTSRPLWSGQAGKVGELWPRICHIGRWKGILVIARVCGTSLPPTQPKLLIHIHFYGHHLQMWTTKKRQVQAKALGNERGFHCKRKEISFMLKSFFTAQLGACLCSGFNYLPYSEYAWNLNLCVPRCMAHKTKLYWIRNVLHTWIHNSGFLDLAVVELQCISRIWSSHSKVWLTNGHNMLPWTSLSDV